MKTTLFLSLFALMLTACSRPPAAESQSSVMPPVMAATTPAVVNDDKLLPVQKTDADWKHILTPEQYDVMRKQGTEAPFTGKYTDDPTTGVYRCAACGYPLFSSGTKYHSGTGWPSFYAPLTSNAVTTAADNSLGMDRTEVRCPRCGAHLGHVFDDGPAPTHLRYCINSVALTLDPKTTTTNPKP